MWNAALVSGSRNLRTLFFAYPPPIQHSSHQQSAYQSNPPPTRLTNATHKRDSTVPHYSIIQIFPRESRLDTSLLVAVTPVMEQYLRLSWSWSLPFLVINDRRILPFHVSISLFRTIHSFQGQQNHHQSFLLSYPTYLYTKNSRYCW